MRCLVRYLTRKGHGEIVTREVLKEGEFLIAGRGNDCGIQLSDSRTLLHHVFFALRGGSLFVTTYGGSDLRVDGVLRDSTRLSIGQKILVGPYEFTIESPAPNTDVTLSVELVQPLGNELESLMARTRSETTRIGLTMRGWSWLLAGAVLLFALAIPLLLHQFLPQQSVFALRASTARPFEASRAGWTSGPITAAHKFFGDNCVTCHRSIFASVPDSACLECHSDMHYHVDPAQFPMTAFGDSHCRDCHKAHRNDISIERASLFCGGCHIDLSRQSKDTTMRAVSDFARNHPEFRPTVLVDPVSRTVDRSRALTDSPRPEQHMGLKFPHDKHLLATGVRDGKGEMVRLTCNGCHVPDQTGVNMRPVEFERDCHDCHPLKFDARIPDRQLLHVKTSDVFKQVRDVYDALALRGGYEEPEAPAIIRRRPGTPLTSDEKKVIADWATAKAIGVLEGRFGKGLCGECHVIVDAASAAKDGSASDDGSPSWDVQPVILNASFFPKAKFTHAKHLNPDCGFCHQTAQSVTLNEVLMPSIKVCQSCHGDEASTDRVPTSCTQCHSFHQRGATPIPFDAPHRANVADGGSTQQAP